MRWLKKNRTPYTMSDLYLVAGLGNPGREYEHTRHNVGFMCADALAQAHGLRFDPKKRSKARVADGYFAGKRLLIAKPQTFMNLSGSAIQGLATFYKIPPERILIIYDDLDLPVGTLRIRPKGGSGGHKGMTDIIRRLGTQDFPRIRFGIGRPPGEMDPAAYVLRPFDRDELPRVQDTIARVVSAVEVWLSDGIDRAMSRYNGIGDNSASSSSPPHPALPATPDHLS